MTASSKDDIQLFCMAIDSVLANTLKIDKFLLVIDGPFHFDLEGAIQKYKDMAQSFTLDCKRWFGWSFKRGVLLDVGGLNLLQTRHIAQ